MPTILLGIDIGTSGVKLGLVDDRGKLLGSATASHDVAHPQPTWAEMDAGLWLDGIADALPRACATAGVDPTQIDAIGFSAMYPVLVPLDANLDPIHPGILYCDQRSIAQVDALSALIPADRFAQIAGNVITPGTCSMTSLAWIKDERPDVFEAARFFAHPPGSVVGKLTGNLVLDCGTASLSGLFDTCRGDRWSQEICDAVGVPMDKLPPVVAPSHRAGELLPDQAERFGLRAGIPVAAGAGDTVCSTLGLGLVEPGQACVTCGTTDNISAVSDRPTFDPCFANCCHAMPGQWIFIPTMSNTGAALEWFKGNFAGAIAGDGSYDALFAAAAQVEPGADGLIFLPYLQGERSPVWDPKAKGVFFGMSLATTPAHMLRALLEGVAFALKQNLDGLEAAGFVPRELVLTGGSTKSALWNQIKADVLGRSLERVAEGETTLLGAALLGGVAAGVWNSVEAAAAAVRDAAAYETIKPDPDMTARYAPLFDIYTTLYPSLRDAFHARYEAKLR